MKKTIMTVSQDSLLLVEKLRAVEVGAQITYSELSQAVGRNVQTEARGCLNTARAILQREDSTLFAPIRGIGLKRLTDGEIAQVGGQTLRHVNNSAKRGIRKLACVRDFNALTNEEKIRHNAAMSVLGVFYEVSKTKGIRQIEAAVAVVQKELPLKEALRAFIGT